MAKYQTKAKAQKSFNKNRADEHIIPANCVAVFPMLIVSGSTYITENGIMPQNLTYDKGSFLFWQEVFDGRKAIKIQWEDAVLLEKPLNEEGNPKNYYLAETKVGKYFYGKPLSNGAESLVIGEDQSFDEFITMKANQTVKLRFEFQKSNRLMFDSIKEDLRFVDNDLYKLYLIPELCEGKLMYISEYEEGYEDKSGLSYWCEITFQSLGSELQKSGQAVEQYPRWSAPGEFYVKPKIEYSVGEVREKRIIIDPVGLHPKPIKYLQVELQGPALTSCMYALGRRQEKDPETGKWKIGPSKHLLGYKFYTTQSNPLNRTSTPSKNFNCYIDEEVVFATNLEMLKDVFEYVGQPLEQMKNGGLITLGVKGEYRDSEPAKGIHLSNDPANNDIQQRFDYFDEGWLPLEHILTEQTKAINTNGCVYAEEEIEYSKADTMLDIMNKNVFTFNQQPIIPLSMYASRPLFLRNIPLIGSIANFFSLGDIHLFTGTTNRKTSELIYFGDSDLCAMCANLQAGHLENGTIFKKNEGRVAFPINFFGNNETSYNKLGVNSVNTSLCIELTDQIQLNINGYLGIFDTILLGQKERENGDPAVPGQPDTYCLVNGSLKATEPHVGGYIIDAVIVQTIFDGKIRMSCYSTDNTELIIPEWTTTILSNASWENGAMRDWTNMYILSNWTDRFCRQQDEFTWPSMPDKPSTEYVILNTNLNNPYTTDNYNRSHAKWLDTDEGWTQSKGNFKEIANSNYVERTFDFDRGIYEIEYTDLGIEEVIDRQSFLDYFENIQVNFNQTRVQLWELTGLLGAECNYNDGFRTIGSFRQGTYTYEFDCPVVALKCNIDTWKNVELESRERDYFHTSTRNPRTNTLDEEGDGGIQCKARVKLEVLEDRLRITAIDKTIFLTWNCDEPRTGYTMLILTETGYYSDNGRIEYKLNLPQVKILRKGYRNKFSNYVFGVGDTKNT